MIVANVVKMILRYLVVKCWWGMRARVWRRMVMFHFALVMSWFTVLDSKLLLFRAHLRQCYIYGSFVESRRDKIDFSKTGKSVEGMRAVTHPLLGAAVTREE
jgi:hypothetical protein